jgi:hypothetical protein
MASEEARRRIAIRWARPGAREEQSIAVKARLAAKAEAEAKAERAAKRLAKKLEREQAAKKSEPKAKRIKPPKAVKPAKAIPSFKLAGKIADKVKANRKVARENARKSRAAAE